MSGNLDSTVSESRLTVTGRAARVPFSRRTLLRWLHVGRLVLVTFSLGWALASGDSSQGTDAAIITGFLFLVAVVITAHSLWSINRQMGEPSDLFVFSQIAFDAVAVAVLVGITGGGLFTPLYILVIASGALVLPLAGGVAVGALAALLYSADAVLMGGVTGPGGWEVTLQVGLFGLVAVAAGILGDRLRRAGLALGEVESELRQLRHTTSDILGTISAGVMTVDGTGRLVYLNPAGERLLGLDADEWTERPVVEVVRGVAPELGALLERSINEGVPFARMTSSLPRPDGDLTLGVSTAVLSQPESERPSVTAIFQDITDQERLADLNRRTERLEAVAELSASLAHEIKNPLASIRSAVEQLSNPSLDPPDQAVLQALVLRESDRLSRLLTEFLGFSGLRIGETEPVELRRLLSECVEVAQQHPDAAVDRVIELHLGPDPVYVHGDPDLLHRAVFNLLLNAVHFAGDGGRVEVTLTATVGREAARGVAIRNPIRISVRDTGPGIEPEILPRIFDAFFTTRSGGTGLGLAVVHRAVEAHDGVVFVELPPDGGTEFVLFLPAVSAPEPGRATPVRGETVATDLAEPNAVMPEAE